MYLRADGSNPALPAFDRCLVLEDLGIRFRGFSPKLSWFLNSFPLTLPQSLRQISLRFYEKWYIIFSGENEANWKAIDATLTSSKFSALTSVEIVWDMVDGSPSDSDELEQKEPPMRKQVVDHLATLHKLGTFSTALPNLYKRGILWCGDSCHQVINTVTEVVLVAEASLPGPNSWSPLYRSSTFDWD